VRAAIPLFALLLAFHCEGGPGAWLQEPSGRALFASPQSHPIALGPAGRYLYVANTTDGSVSVVDIARRREVTAVRVGIDPVSLAVRPDGAELWVSNHVSDSVSVIDIRAGSASRFRVVATIQDLDATGATRFDEPVGIAFASATKAYVALSSRNEIAVVDVDGPRYAVRPERIPITAQDPRAITVRDGRLYVAAFESMNRTELSACPESDPRGAPDCTIHGGQAFQRNPAMPDFAKNIQLDPDAPDRDLFVFDVRDESPVGAPVEGVGTLLYGLAVDGQGRVWVAQTDARNAVDGADGQALADLDNRMFLNQITEVDCGGDRCGAPRRIDLEPPPPQPPAPGRAFATPYGIAVSDDDSTVVATAAGSHRLLAMDVASGEVASVDVGAGPRGLVLHSRRGSGAPETAYVLDTLDDDVSVVRFSGRPGHWRPWLAARIPLGRDPTPEPVRLGRIAFNDAGASTSGTFSCGSCHPDAHTDQLLWRIGGACFYSDDLFLEGSCPGTDQPRLTMPVRGLRNTLPLHWDGSLGDPYGGPNAALGTVLRPPVCTSEHECFRNLVDASLAGVMCDQHGGCATGPSGLAGPLDEAQRDHLASFLGEVSYPPARSRRIDDRVSASALDGFRDFFMERGGTNPVLATCADSTVGCHELPLGTSTKSLVLGFFDAPTMRGMTDRFVQFSLGITASEENLAAHANDYETGAPLWDPARGYDEFTTFAAAFEMIFRDVTEIYGVGPDDIFEMFEEASTGTSGSTGRQVTLSSATTAGPAWAATGALLDALEGAAARDAVDLRGRGLRDGVPVAIAYDAAAGAYRVGAARVGRDELEAEASSGRLLATLTGWLPRHWGRHDYRQPLVSPFPVEGGIFAMAATGDPALPHFEDPDAPPHPMDLRGVDVRGDAEILIDGRPVSGEISCVEGAFDPYCSSDHVEIALAATPPEGTHLLQVQNPQGPRSPEVPVCVGHAAADQGELVSCLP
jgi:YVTN family beta-propeller protein